MNVGIPVSWQIGRSDSHAMSTFRAIVARARAELVFGVSRRFASAISRRTSEGRLFEVWTISSYRLSENDMSVRLLARQTLGFRTVVSRRIAARQGRFDRFEHDVHGERLAEIIGYAEHFGIRLVPPPLIGRYHDDLGGIG